MDNCHPANVIDPKFPTDPLACDAERELSADMLAERAIATDLIRTLHAPVCTEGRRPESLPFVDSTVLWNWCRRRA